MSALLLRGGRIVDPSQNRDELRPMFNMPSPGK